MRARFHADFSRIAPVVLGIAGTAAVLATHDQAQSLGEAAQSISDVLGLSISEAHERAPALVLGFVFMGFIPLLMILGTLAAKRSKERERARQRPDPKREAWKIGNPYVDPEPVDPEPVWPSEAWIELEAAPGLPNIRRHISSPLIRIGRDDENDVCLKHQTVDRFHAAIYRNDDAEFCIRALSGFAGYGVIVNGRRTSEARLSAGDAIEIGAQRIMFHAEPT